MTATDFFTQLFLAMDALLMPVYRIPDNPMFGYYLGTFVLSCICLIIGKYSISFAFQMNKDKIIQIRDEMSHYQDISIKALRSGNKEAFRACNRIANDAYGKNFFSQIALSAASLWPVFPALGWMQYRFAEVDFHMLVPVSGANYLFGYITTFVLCYGTVKTVYDKLKMYAALMRTAE